MQGRAPAARPRSESLLGVLTFLWVILITEYGKPTSHDGEKIENHLLDVGGGARGWDCSSFSTVCAEKGDVNV